MEQKSIVFRPTPEIVEEWDRLRAIYGGNSANQAFTNFVAGLGKSIRARFAADPAAIALYEAAQLNPVEYGRACLRHQQRKAAAQHFAE